jgi:endoribonuclease Dicer
MIISHHRGMLCTPVQKQTCEVTLKDVMKPGTTYLQHLIAKSAYPAERLQMMSKLETHRLIGVTSVVGKFSAENLLSVVEHIEVNHSHTPTVSHLLPEACTVLGPLRYYCLGLMLPSVLWRLQSCFLADECLRYVEFCAENKEESSAKITYPSIPMILEALTPRMAHEIFDSERLEFLGDSIIKLLASITFFTAYPDAQEGALTTVRSRWISNEAQARRIEACGMSQYLRAVTLFTGKRLLQFQPPGRQADASVSLWNEDFLPNIEVESNIEEAIIDEPKNQYCSCRLKGKRLADLLESMIGAYYVAGGLDGARHVIRAMGYLSIEPLMEPQPQVVPDSVVDDECKEARPTDKDFVLIPANYPKQLAQLALRGHITNDDPLDGHVTEDLFRMSSLTDVYSLQSLLGYTFHSISFLEEAFTHPSVPGRVNYQRLEFLGDAVLDAAVIDFLYKSPKKYSEGELSTLKQHFTNNHYLGSFSIRLGLHKYVNCMSVDLAREFKDLQLITEALWDFNEGLISATVVDTMADCFEAMIGAIFLDSGSSLSAVQRIIQSLNLMPDEYFPSN